MKLFYHPGTCSLAPHIVLEEGGFDFALELVDEHHRYSAGDFYAVNPKGYIPALELDDGEILTEGAAIVQHLADIAPVEGLIPAVGTVSRARCVEWLTFTATELHKAFPPLWTPLYPDDLRAKGMDLLQQRIAFTNAHLGRRDYLLGDRFSVADAYLYTVLNWASRIDLDLAQWPHAKAFMTRMEARPKVKKALEVEKKATRA
jgi:glutathione S-transferase